MTNDDAEVDLGLAARIHVLAEQARREVALSLVRVKRDRRGRQQSGSGVDWNAVGLGTMPDELLSERLGCSLDRVMRERVRRNIRPYRGSWRRA